MILKITANFGREKKISRGASVCGCFLLATCCFAGEGVSVGVSLTAGAIAGVAEHCVMYPVDSVKV
jgi:hypothetical protein